MKSDRVLSEAPEGRNSLAIIIDFVPDSEIGPRETAELLMQSIEADPKGLSGNPQPSVRFIKLWEKGIRLLGDDPNQQMCQSFRLEWDE